MVKRVEVTYTGNLKKILYYDIRFGPDKNNIVKFRRNNKDTEVNMNNVLQIRELR